MTVDILKLIDEIYACAAEPANWENAALKMARALGVHAVAMQYQHIDDPQCGMHSIAGFDPAWTADYLRNWDPKNPWRLRAMDAARATPVRERYKAAHASDLVAPSQFRRTDVFNESLKKADLYDYVALPLFASDNGMWLAFFCGKSKNLFNADDLKLASILAPHVARAAQFGAAIEQAAPYLPEGRFGDPRAKTPGPLMSPKTSASPAPTLSPAIMDELGFRLRRRVTQLCTAARVRVDGASMTIGRNMNAGAPKARHIAISAHPTAPLAHAVTNLQRIKPFVTIERRTQRLPPQDTLMREFDLTRSEAEIALMIAHGATPAMIAEHRQNKLSTVRWHIKQIYTKLLVSDRMSMVRKILKKVA